MKSIIPQPESRFLKVKCEKCKNEQTIFSKPASEVKCLVCGEVLAKPKGGKGEIFSNSVEVLE